MSTLRVDNVTDLGDDPVVTAGVVAGGALPAGSILQVVSSTKTNTGSTASTSFGDIGDLSVTITPASTSSKILVLVDGYFSHTSAASSVRINLVRDSTSIAQPDAGSVPQTAFMYPPDTTILVNASFNFLDAPSTTSATTYKVQYAVFGGTGYVNRDSSGNRTAVSTITVMEVAG